MNGTPVEIDTILAELYGQRQSLLQQAARLYELAEKTGQARFEDQAHTKWLEASNVAINMNPFEQEFANRGGWTRAFVVPEGHVHRSMHCSTCYPTTEFGWVTDLSGSTEAEIIEAAGSRACTVCYPTAPVDAPPGRIFHATELAAEQARQERAAKKAAADAKKEANAIGPHRTSSRDRIETVHQAKAYLTNGFDWGWTHPSYSSEDRDVLAGLLATKLGTTPEKELEAAAQRAKNRS